MKNHYLALMFKSVYLFPNQELRIDVNNQLSKYIIDSTLKIFKGEMVLLISDNNNTGNNIDEIPGIGIKVKIKNKIILPNNDIRITIRGIKRVKIVNKINNDDGTILVNIENFNQTPYNLNEEQLFIRKIKKLLINYCKNETNISEDTFNLLNSITSLSKLTDMLAATINCPNKLKYKLFIETNYYKRARIILSHLNNEINISLLEEKLDDEIRNNFEKGEKDIIVKQKIDILMRELGQEKDKYVEVLNYEKAINSLNIDKKIKEEMRNELKKFELTLESSPELGIIRSHLDFLINLPWNKLTKDKDVNIIRDNINEVYYGMNDTKERILEYLALKSKNKKIHTPVLCLIGPPGTGKTTFAKILAESMGRKFAKICVGGLTDPSELLGHRKTYIGASPGKIMEQINRCGSKNPIILIDEVDKIGNDYKGDPSSILLDILDPNQNCSFMDNYVSEPFDLSNVLFILTANSEQSIPEPLRDRLEIIEISSYTLIEKIEIAQKYTIPRLCKEYGCKTGYIKMNSNVVKEIILNYTNEQGVRDLERRISQIIRKSLLLNKDKQVTIKNENLVELLGKPKYILPDAKELPIGSSYVPACSNIGGKMIVIETALAPGDGIIALGNVGEILMESIDISIGYIKSHTKELKIDSKKLKNQIYLNMSEIGIKKDGPSAGVALTVALISLFLNKKVDSKITFTGEIGLNGQITKVGGLKEKIIASLNLNLKTIYIPYDNIVDIEEIPKNFTKNLNIIPVTNFMEIYNQIF